MTLIASGTGYIEFFRPAQAEGNFQCEQTIVHIELLYLNLIMPLN